MKTQKGFSIVEGLLILVIVGLIGGTGWYVWQSQQNANKSLDSASWVDTTTALPKKDDIKKETEKAAEDPTKGWKAYSNKEGQFSLRYPSSWVQASHPELCSPGLLLLGANASSVGVCASDSGSQIFITSDKGDHRSSQELSKKYYPDVKTEEIVVSGVTGKRQTGTYKRVAGEEGIGPATGDKTVAYTFYANGRTYYASYSIDKMYPDVLKEFDLMMTKTFKFSA